MKVNRARREEEIGLDILVNTVSSADLGARYGGPGDEYDTNKLLSMVNGGFTQREEADGNETNADAESERGEDGERHGGHKKKKNKTKKVKQPKDKECFTKIILIREKIFYFKIIISTKLFILFFIIYFSQFWKWTKQNIFML